MNQPSPKLTSVDLQRFPQFLLRADFPEENCWVDQARVPLTRAAFDAYYRQGFLAYDQYLRRLPSITAGPTFAYLGEIDAHTENATYHLTDGHGVAVVEFEGLFADLCWRVNAALKLPAGAPCPILPVRPEHRHPAARVLPESFVFHDRDASTAYVIPTGMWGSVQWQPWLPY